MAHDSDHDLKALSELMIENDRSRAEELLMKHRSRLRRMVAARLDPRLVGRIDPSDIVQEAYIEAFDKLPNYVREQPLPVYPWLRQLAANRLSDAYQKHLHAQRRSVTREIHLGLSSASIGELAGRLVSFGSTPSRQLAQQELQQEVREALDRLSVVDREVLILRFVEQLSNQETAEVLGISPEAVGMRRIRALRKMSDLLEGLDE